ncbi:C40 family peptidase [Streptomyces griseus]|uniref:C40 family peptidase n=1 Tax=Streptomyces griseus TaxID=1911 RepID=UPI00056BE0C9|nr:C40 family peptidase [Streptomyces griseus]
MATDRSPRTSGLGLPEGDAEPSREEIQQRINALYNRAESDSGTFNATRAMSTASSLAAPAGSRDNVARQWFDVARSKLGPTVSAVLPPDRMPARPAASRPTKAPERTTDAPPPARELPAAPERRAAPELSARTALAALPAASGTRPNTSAGPAPTARAQQSTPRTAKERNQRKLTAARDLLGRHTAQRPSPVAALEAAPATRPWDTGSLPAVAPQASPTTRPWDTGNMPTVTPQPSSATRPWDTGNMPTVTPQPSPATQPWDTGNVPAMTPQASPATRPWDTGNVPTVTPQPSPAPQPWDTGNVPAMAPQASPATQPWDTGNVPTVTPQPSPAPQPWDTGNVPAMAPPQASPATGPWDTGSLPVAPALSTPATQPWDTGALPAVPAQTAPPAQTWDTGSLPVTQPAAEAWRTQQPAPAGQPFAPAPAAPLPVSATPAVSAPSVGAAESAYQGKAARALDFARAQVGKPCVWGANGPTSYDCSSLTQAAWRTAGVALPRSAQEQALTGTAIPLSDLQVGDLVFFHDAGHVGLYAGNGMMIHAPSPGAYIREESVLHAGESAVLGAVRPA